MHRAKVSQGVLLLSLLMVGIASATPAMAGEFMFMPTVAVIEERRPNNNDPSLEKNQVIADFFYSSDVGQFRFLGELQIDRHGQDLERLQAGWRLTPELTLWLGRYHNPIGYWNVEHHHGHYMETSAERPRILEFEDDGGPLPIHLAGFLLQGTQALGTAGLQYELGIASGPRVEDGEFEPVDLLRDRHLNRQAVVARLGYRPDATQDDQYGFFLARTEIPVEDDISDKVIEQGIGGFYVSHDFNRLKLFAEGFRIRHRLLQGSGENWPSYWAGYAQAEYKWVPNVWTPFIRLEAVTPRLSGEYVTLFPKLPRQRQVAGVRWDFYQNQALKFELIRDRSFSDATFHALEIQWSAMF